VVETKIRRDAQQRHAGQKKSGQENKPPSQAGGWRQSFGEQRKSEGRREHIRVPGYAES
jgi:hypothetical protein